MLICSPSRPPPSARPSRATIVEALRALALLGSAAFQADRRLAAWAVVLRGLMWLHYPIVALSSKLLLDGSLGGDVSWALLGAALLAASWSGSIVIDRISAAIGISLSEKTAHRLEQRLIELWTTPATLELHERPDALDRRATFRSQMRNLGNVTSLIESSTLILNVAATAVLLVALHPALLLVPFATLPSLYLAQRAERLLATAEANVAGTLRVRRNIFELATQPGPGKEIRIFGIADELLRRHATAWRAYGQPLGRAQLWYAALMAVGWSAFALAFMGAVLFMVGRAIEGAATAGDVLLVLVLLQSLQFEAASVVWALSGLARAVTASRHLLWLADEVAADRVSPGARPAPSSLQRGLELEGVHYRYPGTDRDAVHDVSLRVPAGSTVAFLGDNGAGKTTVVKLLCGLIRPTGGRLSVDGVDLATMDLGAWQAAISAGFQDFAKLEFRLRESVGVGELFSIEEPRAAAVALGRAGASDLADSLGAGLETQLGAGWERGVDLSVGQWQKVALGRAMVRQHPLLLVLDEPTASLDAETEHALFERFAEASRARAASGAITLLVSHRFSTVQMADLIVVMDAGTVKEVGTHRDLLKAGGVYAELYSLQAKGYA